MIKTGISNHFFSIVISFTIVMIPMSFQNLNALRHFEAAARHLNLRLAAEELHVTQGAVSQQIRVLEDVLQTRLFTRHPRGLSLTEAGHRLHEPVAQALGLISSSIAELHSFSDRVTLSLPPSLAAKWLVPRLPGFAEAHPNVELQIVASERITDFARDNVDLAIRQGPAPQESAVTVEKLAHIRLVAVTGPSLVARAPVLARASFFAQYPLIEDGHRPWQAWFAREAPETPWKRLSFNQTALAIDAAEAGQGIALVPDVLVNDALEKRRLVRLREEPPDETRGLYLVRPAKTPETRSHRAVADWIRAGF